MVGKNLPFAQAMRIAEGMSYNHSQVIIKARGKQIQRAVEISTMLENRERGVLCTSEIGCEHRGDLHIPCITITMETDGVQE